MPGIKQNQTSTRYEAEQVATWVPITTDGDLTYYKCLGTADEIVTAFASASAWRRFVIKSGITSSITTNPWTPGAAIEIVIEVGGTLNIVGSVINFSDDTKISNRGTITITCAAGTPASTIFNIGNRFYLDGGGSIQYAGVDPAGQVVMFGAGVGGAPAARTNVTIKDLTTVWSGVLTATKQCFTSAASGLFNNSLFRNIMFQCTGSITRARYFCFTGASNVLENFTVSGAFTLTTPAASYDSLYVSGGTGTSIRDIHRMDVYTASYTNISGIYGDFTTTLYIADTTTAMDNVQQVTLRMAAAATQPMFLTNSYITLASAGSCPLFATNVFFNHAGSALTFGQVMALDCNITANSLTTGVDSKFVNCVFAPSVAPIVFAMSGQTMFDSCIFNGASGTIGLGGASNMRFLNCYFSSTYTFSNSVAPSTGLYIVGCAGTAPVINLVTGGVNVIHDLRLINNTCGIYLYCPTQAGAATLSTGLVIDNCHIYIASPVGAPAERCLLYSDVTIENSYISNATAFDTVFGDSGTASTSWVVRRNNFTTSSKFGGSVFSNITFRNISRLFFEDNYVNCTREATASMKSVCFDTVTDLHIKNNQFLGLFGNTGAACFSVVSGTRTFLGDNYYTFYNDPVPITMTSTEIKSYGETITNPGNIITTTYTSTSMKMSRMLNNIANVMVFASANIQVSDSDVGVCTWSGTDGLGSGILAGALTLSGDRGVFNGVQISGANLLTISGADISVNGVRAVTGGADVHITGTNATLSDFRIHDLEINATYCTMKDGEIQGAFTPTSVTSGTWANVIMADADLTLAAGSFNNLTIRGCIFLSNCEVTFGDGGASTALKVSDSYFAHAGTSVTFGAGTTGAGNGNVTIGGATVGGMLFPATTNDIGP